MLPQLLLAPLAMRPAAVRGSAAHLRNFVAATRGSTPSRWTEVERRGEGRGGGYPRENYDTMLDGYEHTRIYTPILLLLPFAVLVVVVVVVVVVLEVCPDPSNLVSSSSL